MDNQNNYIDILKDYLIKGGSKDKYIDAYTDEHGNYHSGYRGYEKVAPLKDQLKDIIKPIYGDSSLTDDFTNKIYNKVMELIDNCQNFYSFNRDEMKFRNTLFMGATPTSNPETVKKWWKEHYNMDIEIEERIPRLFWYYDHGYTDEDLAEEFEDLGENWKGVLYKEWKEGKNKNEYNN